jgi:P-type Ca2+ transporter type 2B
MVKHIIATSVYQIIVIYAVCFGGEHFFPEPDAKYRFERAPLNTFLYPGRLYNWDETPLYINKYQEFGASRHLTNVFNIFVVLQIFNMINCRKINDEKNIFDGLFSNYMFPLIWLIIVIGQAIIVEFGSTVMKCAPAGLAWSHWVIAIILGLI